MGKRTRNTWKQIGIAGFFILLAVGGRTVFHVGPNIELLTTSTLLASTYLRKNIAFFVPLVSVALSDFILGNSSIYLFTWSAWIIIGVASTVLQGVKYKKGQTVLYATGWSIGTTGFFFLWTNFGVWLQGWYGTTIMGLFQSYYRGIPFLLNQLAGNLLFVPLFFLVAEIAASFLSEKKRVFSLRP
ncbi:MAG TPA: DUF6580 family putative transport protein [Patescibacteria group bacterium]|nr:DUF6580 family putative transport protein [Patescibacteria group bacterium]